MLNPITILIGILAICNMLLGGSTFYYYHQYIEVAKYKDQVREEQEYSKLIKHESDIKYQDIINRHAVDIKRLRNSTKTSVLPVARKPDETEICFSREQLDRTIQSYRHGIQELISIGSECQIDLDNAREWAIQLEN